MSGMRRMMGGKPDALGPEAQKALAAWLRKVADDLEAGDTSAPFYRAILVVASDGECEYLRSGGWASWDELYSVAGNVTGAFGDERRGKRPSRNPLKMHRMYDRMKRVKVMRHRSENPHECRWRFCDRRFRTARGAAQHASKCRDQFRLERCPNCGFEPPHGLLNGFDHTTNEHLYNCPKCKEFWGISASPPSPAKENQ